MLPRSLLQSCVHNVCSDSRNLRSHVNRYPSERYIYCLYIDLKPTVYRWRALSDPLGKFRRAGVTIGAGSEVGPTWALKNRAGIWERFRGFEKSKQRNNRYRTVCEAQSGSGASFNDPLKTITSLGYQTLGLRPEAHSGPQGRLCHRHAQVQGAPFL